MKRIFTLCTFLMSFSAFTQDLTPTQQITLKDVISSGGDTIYCEIDGISILWKSIVLDIQTKEAANVSSPYLQGPKVDRLVFSPNEEESFFFPVTKVKMSGLHVMIEGKSDSGDEISLIINRTPGHYTLLGKLEDRIGDYNYPGSSQRTQGALLHVGDKAYKMECFTVKLPDEK